MLLLTEEQLRPAAHEADADAHIAPVVISRLS